MQRFPLLVCACLAAATLHAQPEPTAQQRREAEERRTAVRATYTKHEFLVPMRDGVRLFTAVYTPKDRSQPAPILLNRTPYTVAPYGADNYRDRLGPSPKFAGESWIFVYQDVRGKGRSEGQFVHVRPHNPNKRTPKDIDEASDTYDTVEWLVKNIPANNGRAGMWGISYPGFYAGHGAIDSHPALKATSPQAPVTDWFVGDDFRHNGVVFLAHAFNFFGAFGRPEAPENTVRGPRFEMGTPDGYDFFLRTGALANIEERYFRGQVAYWKELLDMDRYDAYWKSRDLRAHMRAVKPAMMTVGGWFDAEDLYGPLRLYETAERTSPGANNTLVMGPWIHGGWARREGDRLGHVRFHSNTSRYFQEQIEHPFFVRYLREKTDVAPPPEAFMFETGRNEWHKLAAWPPAEAKAKTLYFRASGKLGWTPPDAAGAGFDEYLSDPSKPVPFTAGVEQGMVVTYMVEDQRFATARPDVLAYETEPLAVDLRVAGPLKATLYVSTTGTDSDFVVKLIDVYPNDFPDPEPEGYKMGGYQQLVRGEPFRGKFRKSFETPEPFEPGRMEKVEFELPDVFHTFRRGHRVMVHVQSSWFPLTDRNPQKFLKISEARNSDFVKATQRVFRQPQAASGLTVRILE